MVLSHLVPQTKSQDENTCSKCRGGQLLSARTGIVLASLVCLLYISAGVSNDIWSQDKHVGQKAARHAMIQRAVQGMAQATRERERSLPLLTVSMPSDSSEIDSTNALTVSPSPQTAAPTSQPKAAVAKPAVNTGPAPSTTMIRMALFRDLTESLDLTPDPAYSLPKTPGNMPKASPVTSDPDVPISPVTERQIGCGTEYRVCSRYGFGCGSIWDGGTGHKNSDARICGAPRPAAARPLANDELTSSLRILCMLPVAYEGAKSDSFLAAVLEMSNLLARNGCSGVRIVIAQRGAGEAGSGQTVHVGRVLAEGRDLRMDNRVRVVTLNYAHRDDNNHNLWQKLHHMLLYMHNHELEQYDWFVKIDPDGVFVPANFRKLVAAKFPDPEVPAYIGHAFYFHPRTAFIAGCGCTMSRGTLRKLGPNLKTAPFGPTQTSTKACGDLETHMDDLELGLCLRKAGIFINSSRDDRGREHYAETTFAYHYMHRVLPFNYSSPPRWEGLTKPNHDSYWIGKDMRNIYDNSLTEWPACAHGYKPNALRVMREIFSEPFGPIHINQLIRRTGGLDLTAPGTRKHVLDAKNYAQGQRAAAARYFAKHKNDDV